MLPKNHTDSADQSDSIGLYLQFESLSNVKTTHYLLIVLSTSNFCLGFKFVNVKYFLPSEKWIEKMKHIFQFHFSSS